MTSPSGRRAASLLLIGVAGVLSWPSRAAACSNAVAEVEEEDPQVVALRAADKALDGGEPGRAFSLVRSETSNLERAAPRVGDDPIAYRTNRALRISALAVIRTGGDAGPGTSNAPNLRWARSTLAALAKLRDAPMQETDLAEAREVTEPEAAKAALEDLARRDLLVTPYGYGALARLRAEEGDTAGRDQAALRCLRMAVVATICDPPKADRSLRRRALVWMRVHWQLGLVLGAIGAAVAWLLVRRRTLKPAVRVAGSAARA
jgi:hypothetical protein